MSPRQKLICQMRQRADTPLASRVDRPPSRAVQAGASVARYLWGVVLNLIEASRRWRRDDAGLLAACVAYYATLSLFPLLIVLIAGLGVFLEFTAFGQHAEKYVLAAIEQET